VEREGREDDNEQSVRTNISSQDVLDLLLLKTTLNDETTCTVYTTSGTHFGEEKLYDMFGLESVVK
jgi:hypothetical protein